MRRMYCVGCKACKLITCIQGLIAGGEWGAAMPHPYCDGEGTEPE